MESKVTIFTDGASRDNPGPGGFAAVISDGKNVTEIGGSEKNTTNNRMEITAAISALEFLFLKQKSSQAYRLVVYSDSSYLVNGITKWVLAWEKNNWRTKIKQEVLNKDLWLRLSDACNKFKKIEWHIVSGHVGLPGNERADKIATSLADGRLIKLYSGESAGYDLDLSDISRDEIKQERKSSSKKHSQKPAFSYVSLVGGVVLIHKTWADCEKRVKGQSGARFKKALSLADEQAIITEFKKTVAL